MTEKQILDRLKELDVRLTQITADYNACSGAKQDCEFWLSQIQKDSEKESVDAEKID